MKHSLILSFAILAPALSLAGDWPEWCGTKGRNMVSNEKGLPVDFSPGKKVKGKDEIDLATTKNVKWITKLGSQTYGTPTVSKGKVFIGTNNESPRDKGKVGDRGILYCIDEKTGKFLWQFVAPKLAAGKVNDWEFLGICASAGIEGDRAYVVTNQCEVVCLDVNALANGNDGPFKDEAKFMTPPAAPGQPAPTLAEVTPIDADIIWRYSMRDELGVFPHNMTSSSPTLVGDQVFVTTSNGVDWTHTNIPNTQAPSFLSLNKQTGEYIAEEGSKISTRILHCSWSSPASGKIGDAEQVIFAAGDGWVYGYALTSKKEDDLAIMDELWRYDANPHDYRFDQSAMPRKYATSEGPSEIISTPVIYKDRVYVAIGQDPEHGEGVGMLSCIDATKRGDITKGGAIWTYKEIGRSISTVSIHEGLLYIAEYAGMLHCLDAETGKKHWVYDTKGHIWGSTLVADGKVYLGNEEGELTILATGKEMKKIATIDFPAPILCSPVAANGCLLIPTQTHLYCFAEGAKPTGQDMPAPKEAAK
jgi:outer membrane protein assembly factor BamB